MSRKLANVFIGLFALQAGVFTSAAQDRREEESKNQRVESEQHDLSTGTTAYRLVESRTETKRGKVETQTLETLSIEGEYEPFVETEQETIRVNSRITRLIRRLFARDPDGRRKVIEILEEEQRKEPSGRLQVNRTISKPDVNGRFQVTRREIQETVPVNTRLRQTRTTVLLLDINGRFAPSEQIHEVERRESPGAVQIERTHLLLDGNGRWETYEERVRVVRGEAKETGTEEEHIYRRDANGELSLAERTLSRQWKDAEGKEHHTVETYSKNIAGTTGYGDDRLHLDQRLHTIGSTRPDGRQQEVRELERRSLVAPADGLRVVERVVEVSDPDGEEIDKQREVQALDGNRRLRKIITLKARESQP